MKNRYLFPHQFQRIGWILFGAAFLLGIALLATDHGFEFGWLNFDVFAIAGSSKGFLNWYGEHNMTQELCAVLLIWGGLLVSCSREKQEDEFIAAMRLESLLWALYANYGVLTLAILLVFDLAFLQVMIYNMFTLLIIFLVRFRIVLYRASRPEKAETYA